MPVPEERLASVRAYLQHEFEDWNLADQWDGNTQSHAFRLTKHGEPVHLLKVSREFLEDNQPAEIAAAVAHWNAAGALRAALQHRVLMTSNGLQLLPPPAN